MDNVSWSIGFYAMPTSKRWLYHKTMRPSHFKSHNPHCRMLCGRVHMKKMRMKSHAVWMRISSHYLKAHDHIKLNFYFTWYGLWVSFKAPHNFIVMALGCSVKMALSNLESQIFCKKDFCTRLKPNMGR